MLKALNIFVSPCLRGGCLLLIALLLAGNVIAQPAAHPEMVVSTAWLADHLKEPKVVVVHIAPTDEAYRKQHIPGARLMLVSQIANVPDFPGTELLPADRIADNLASIGISDSSHVVIYTTDVDPIATRLFFTLDYLGHGGHASLLDGGLKQWLAENRPVTTEVPAVTRGKFRVKENKKALARFDWVRKNTANSSARVAVVDARSRARYEAGHLPGAQSLYWQDMIENGMLKPPEQLRKMFGDAGAAKGRKMVSYCESGRQASYVYFVGRYLGLDAAMYDGSLNEWSKTKEPVVIGSSPR